MRKEMRGMCEKCKVLLHKFGPECWLNSQEHLFVLQRVWFGFLAPHCGSQLSVSPVPEDLPSLDLSEHQTHKKCTHIWSSKVLINTK